MQKEIQKTGNFHVRKTIKYKQLPGADTGRIQGMHPPTRHKEVLT